MGEIIYEGGGDAWGWSLERRPDGWHLSDVTGQKKIALATASYETAFKRGLVIAARTYHQVVEYFLRISLPERLAKQLWEKVDSNSPPTDITATAEAMCREAGYEWDEDCRGCQEPERRLIPKKRRRR